MIRKGLCTVRVRLTCGNLTGSIRTVAASSFELKIIPQLTNLTLKFEERVSSRLCFKHFKLGFKYTLLRGKTIAGNVRFFLKYRSRTLRAGQ